jgi:hypothetical protein
MSETSDSASEDEFHELAELSADNLQYVYADVLDRRESYDSRWEARNEDYEHDDFVVDNDDEGDEEGEGSEGSEITLVEEGEGS